LAQPQAEIGVFGGSGFYSFLDGVSDHTVKTPYGEPSDAVAIGEVAGRRVAFLPRHGRKHQFPPHKIPYQANVWAMKELGVKHIIGPCAAGSLKAKVAPGHFVICDQIVDRTTSRPHTFYDGAESRWFSDMGWSVINMTGYPEALLARELEIAYANISLITDYDVGLEGMEGVEPVSHAEVVRVFEENNAKLRELLFALLPEVPEEPSALSATALTGARFEV
jgi:5'-methylthioadenosine phosphorylase